MNSTILIPPLFASEPGFDDLRDGSLVRVSWPDGDENIGVLQVTRQEAGDRFGALVRFGPPDVTGDAPPPTADRPELVATGHAGLPVHLLALEELRRIERTGDSAVPFALRVMPPPADAAGSGK